MSPLRGGKALPIARWISACGDWEKAVALLADLPRRSLEPDKVSYTAAPRRESGGSGGFGKVLDGSVQEATRGTTRSPSGALLHPFPRK